MLQILRFGGYLDLRGQREHEEGDDDGKHRITEEDEAIHACD